MASHNRTHASDRGKAVVDIPGIPTIGTATAGPESATVEFTANVKGGAATSWTALSNPGSITGTGSSSPVTVSGLTAGTAYTFTVRGNNATGSGEYSSVSNSITPTVNTSYESIETITLTSVATSITFSSIPQTYKHLQIRCISAGDQNTSVRMRLNGDTGSNYSWHGLQAGPGYGSGVYANYGASDSSMMMFDQQLSSSIYYNPSICDILEYTNTSKYKTIKTLSGVEGSTGFLYLQGGLWLSTSAITSITIKPNSFNFQDKSTFALYGIKG